MARSCLGALAPVERLQDPASPPAKDGEQPGSPYRGPILFSWALCIHTLACKNTCVCMQMYMYEYMHIHVHTYMYIHIYVYTVVCQFP